MIEQRLPYLLTYAAAVILSCTVLYYAWKNRGGAGIDAFAWSILLEIFWLIGYFFEIISPTKSGKLFWDNLQWAGALLAPVALVIFALEFTGRKVKSWRLAVVLSILPTLALLAILTNIWPELLHTQLEVRPGVLFDELTYGFGPIISFANYYLYLISLAYISILISGFFQKRGIHRRQLLIVTIGTLVPIVGSILALSLDLKFADQRDISPLTFVLSNAIVAWGILRYRLFNIISIARETLFENFEDVLIILDRDDRIVDANPAGQVVLGGGKDLIGTPIGTHLPDLYEQFRGAREVRTEISLDGDIHYELRIIPLYDRSGELSGRLINAHEITRQKRVEQELQASNEKNMSRASQLQAVTQLSEAIAKLQDLNELLPAATRLIGERFRFYHVGVFLLDSDREYVVLQAANSGGGQRMIERGHRLKLGTGVVGYAARTGIPRIALDVGADAVFFDNPDLPNTRSEVALPLKSRGETIGVLDVQSTEAGAFSSEDVQVLTTLANQVSIAFENARLLTETRAALTQVQEVYNEFTRAEWSRTASLAEQAGFRYRSGRIEIVEEELQTPEVVSAVENGQVTANRVNGSEGMRTAVAIPVKLRGEVIGVLHIESNDPAREWQEDEISLVEAVAERAAFAMENARLFQDARRRAAKEQLISEASAKIGSAFNLENILRTTAEELERVLGGSEVLIQFRNKEQS
jgi:GAF domain-containing protein/PAS domain-containing protein